MDDTKTGTERAAAISEVAGSVAERTHNVLGAVGNGTPQEIIQSLVNALAVSILVTRSDKVPLEDATEIVVQALRLEVSARHRRLFSGRPQ
jgi:hypothetical protein